MMGISTSWMPCFSFPYVLKMKRTDNGVNELRVCVDIMSCECAWTLLKAVMNLNLKSGVTVRWHPDDNRRIVKTPKPLLYILNFKFLYWTRIGAMVNQPRQFSFYSQN